jgi:aquaporin Z
MRQPRILFLPAWFIFAIIAVLISTVSVSGQQPASGGSAPAGIAGYAVYWHTLWIYFIAPTVGMLAAAETFLRIRRGVAPYCAKLHHANDERCIFHHAP